MKIQALHIKQYLTTCFQIQSLIIFSFFFVTYLAYIFFLSYVAIFHLLRIWEGVGMHCNFIPSLIESAPARILFPSQYITKFLILIGEVFLKQHIVIRQPASLFIIFFYFKYIQSLWSHSLSQTLSHNLSDFLNPNHLLKILITPYSNSR